MYDSSFRNDKGSVPLLINLPIRAKVVMEEMCRNLIACGNLLTVEGDAEEEFWETEFQKSKNRIPIPSARPLSLLGQVKRKIIRVASRSRRRLAHPTLYPSGKSKKKNKKSRQDPLLIDRVMKLTDFPKFPQIFSRIVTLFVILLFFAFLALAPLAPLNQEPVSFKNGLIYSSISIGSFFLFELIIAKIAQRRNNMHPAFCGKIDYLLT